MASHISNIQKKHDTCSLGGPAAPLRTPCFFARSAGRLASLGPTHPIYLLFKSLSEQQMFEIWEVIPTFSKTIPTFSKSPSEASGGAKEGITEKQM
jgi:hypothetical protein